MLEESGPETLRARALTAEVGTSTQALYTLFGGMPGLFEALVADGFRRFAAYVAAVPETDDPVADFFAKGWAFVEWALTHPQLYRLMFGITGDGLRRHAGLAMTVAGAAEQLARGAERDGRDGALDGPGRGVRAGPARGPGPRLRPVPQRHPRLRAARDRRRLPPAGDGLEVARVVRAST